MSNIDLSTIEDIKNYFKNNNNYYYFISATNFNLMSISDWVKNWFNINFIDCYDKQNNSVILAQYKEIPVLNNIESINQFLLGNKNIVDHIKSTQSSDRSSNAMFLFYDKNLEKLVKSLDMNLIMPPNKLVKYIDNKINTTEIGNSVNVPSVPNALVKIQNYSRLREVINEYKLSNNVVIQTAYGDSGKTTFFISSEEDYQKYADIIESEEQVKIMKHIKCLQVAMEACATLEGTFIGPILTEIIGHPKLTPYKGGWCGNDVNPGIFDEKTQNVMYQYTEKLGQALYLKGYRGYFEVDYLVDTDDKNNMQVYLGEINPRVTGISAVTNMSDFCSKHIPLYLFHLLEFSDVKFSLNPADFNQSVREYPHPDFGQLIFKYTDEEIKILTSIPDTGIYSISNNKLKYLRFANNPSALSPNEIYILRILTTDEYVYKGADVLILFSDKRLQDVNNILTPAADSLISIIHNSLEYRDLNEEEILLNQRYRKHATIKSSADTHE